MTNRDAINLLEEVKILDDTMYAYNSSYLEALDMALTALEAEETWYATHEYPQKSQWIPCSERLPDDNREVEVTCETRRFDGKKYRYTCHASYVHRYSIESTDYCNWEDCDEYNEEEDKYYALSGWYERVHNWDDYSYCAIEDFVIAWREQSEPYGDFKEENE